MVLPAVLTVLGAMLGATVFMQPLLMLGMDLALRSTRIRRSAESVELRGLDGIPFSMALIGTLALTSGAVGLCCVLELSAWGPLVTAALGLAVASGLRLHLTITPAGATFTRALCGIPWRRVRAERATAWVDGWGDEADPLALSVGTRAPRELGSLVPGFCVELGWDLGHQGRADRLAADLERESRALRDR